MPTSSSSSLTLAVDLHGRRVGHQREEPEGIAVAHFTPPTTLVRIMGRALSNEAAEREGRLVIDGDRERRLEFLRLLSFGEVE
jgi:hypothetical protein